MTDRRPLRERKKAALRNELSMTTVLLARERGLDHVRVEDIVRRVGVSRRTFGNYFPSKEDAIADRHVQRVWEAAESLLRRPDSERMWDSVTEALLAPYEGTNAVGTPSREEQAGLLAVLSTPGMQSAVDRGARKANAVLADAIAARLQTAPNDSLPASVAAAALSTLVTTLEFWASGSDPEPLQPLLRRAFARLGAGFDHLD